MGTKLNSENTNPKKLLNWSELSRMITRGDRNGIRANKIPEKHKTKVTKLIRLIIKWQEWAGIK